MSSNIVLYGAIVSLAMEAMCLEFRFPEDPGRNHLDANAARTQGAVLVEVLAHKSRLNASADDPRGFQQNLMDMLGKSECIMHVLLFSCSLYLLIQVLLLSLL
ncbi:hypothetical protein LSTR_LSTR017350 [Laodelphax striatellus]|uniref:Uncharacterized protein n=1 Tax=Laodelphax striatellus TaxID=195883 RepID=A0A482WU43_LAOST|nr:hypothetical protein LSTR_LSTR017350 [Laodelphax striatellus]